MVQWCIRRMRLTLAYEVKILKKKKTFRLAARNRLCLSLPLSFSSSSYSLFSPTRNKKNHQCLPLKRSMARTISQMYMHVKRILGDRKSIRDRKTLSLKLPLFISFERFHVLLFRKVQDK